MDVLAYLINLGGGSEGIVEESEGRIQVELNVSDLESSWHPKI